MSHEQKDLVVSVLVHFVTMGILGGFLIVNTFAWPGGLVVLGFIPAILIECWRPASGGDVVDNRIMCGILSMIAVMLAGLATLGGASFALSLLAMFGIVVPAIGFLVIQLDRPSYVEKEIAIQRANSNFP